MPKHLTIQPHLSVEELETQYRQASDPIERTRYQIVWLLSRGFLTSQVATVTGYCLDGIRQIARRYNKQAPNGLVDRRHQHPGGEPMLSDVQQAQLWQVLQSQRNTGGWKPRIFKSGMKSDTAT